MPNSHTSHLPPVIALGVGDALQKFVHVVKDVRVPINVIEPVCASVLDCLIFTPGAPVRDLVQPEMMRKFLIYPDEPLDKLHLFYTAYLVLSEAIEAAISRVFGDRMCKLESGFPYYLHAVRYDSLILVLFDANPLPSIANTP